MPLGFYLHIPFCARKCDYCAFHSVTSWNANDESRLVDKILKDAQLLAANRLRRDDTSTIYIGGGTPSLLSAGHLVRLVKGIRTVAGRVTEITCEANPESAERDFVDAACEAGVGRLSLGVQTFNTDLCARIGRTAVTERIVSRIRSRWTGSLSADLIISAPEQDTEHVLRDVQVLADIGVDHLSLYDLALEPGTPLAKSYPTGIDSSVDWHTIRERLHSCGFERYEVSNFAKAGHECRHNLGYWKSHPYLGLGPSAVSSLVIDGRHVRLTQAALLGVYLSTDPVTDSECEVLTRRDRMKEYLLLGLRTSHGISRSRYEELFGEGISAHAETAIAGLAADGLLTDDGDSIAPTQRGMDLLNSVLVTLFRVET